MEHQQLQLPQTSQGFICDRINAVEPEAETETALHSEPQKAEEF